MKTKQHIYKIVTLVFIALIFQNCAAVFPEFYTEGEIETMDNEYNKRFIEDLEDFNYTFPQQTIGVSAGVGFENDFEETSFCLGADYNYRLTQDETKRNAFYLGTYGYIDTSSFNDNKWNAFSLGVKPHLQIPITPLREGQLTFGVKASYDFGTEEFGDFKETFNGFHAGVYSGFDIRVNKKLTLGIEFPIFSHVNYTFEPEDGGENFDISNSSLLINLDNPAMFYAKFTLGGNN